MAGPGVESDASTKLAGPCKVPAESHKTDANLGQARRGWGGNVAPQEFPAFLLSELLARTEEA
jgi:hypothetical protein